MSFKHLSDQSKVICDGMEYDLTFRDQYVNLRWTLSKDGKVIGYRETGFGYHLENVVRAILVKPGADTNPTYVMD